MESSAPSPSHPRWLLDELATAGRENLDPDHVARYDDKEDAKATGELAVLFEHGLDQRCEVVDLGAGTGQFTFAVAGVCARVVAVDVSPLMLARLRTKLAASGLSNVEVVRAGFLTYEHRGQPADIVYSRWALHHLPDFWKSVALRRMRSFVRDGGVLRLSDVVYCFEPSDAEERIEAWCATLPTTAVGKSDWTRADIEEHVRDEHSTYAWLLEPMIERSGFWIESTVYSPDGFFAEYIARAI
ncbi:MAG TPA: class I SAM-dependent methyltransferase [Acidimicrobiales bacterium]|nr:class I SAM-dependent methyltransferase [Acidimicrobiales bacterium]